MEISSLPQNQAIWPSKSGYLRSEVSDCRKQTRTRSQKLVVRLLLAFIIQISVRRERARLEIWAMFKWPNAHSSSLL